MSRLGIMEKETGLKEYKEVAFMQPSMVKNEAVVHTRNTTTETGKIHNNMYIL